MEKPGQKTTQGVPESGGFVDAPSDAPRRHPSPEPDEMAFAEARIYRRSASPVQSGSAHESEWVLEFEPTAKPGVDSVMGWTSSCDVLQQVRLSFPSQQAAESYCKRESIPYTVTVPHERKPRRRTYTDNFVEFEGGPKPIYPH